MARRIQISRRRPVGYRVPWLHGLAARVAICGVLLFLGGSLVAHWATVRAGRLDRHQRASATEWADRLMFNSGPTPYGWVPSKASSTYVDEQLAAVGAAFVMLDSSDRVVRASAALSTGSSSVVQLGSGSHATVPPLGRVEVRRVPVRVFGQLQGLFLLLRPPGVELPPPAPWSETYVPIQDRPRRTPEWIFLGIGSAFVALGLFAAVHFLAANRLQRMTRSALGPGARADGTRRFAEVGADEVGHLSDALDAMLRRTRRLIKTMTDREGNRRDWLSELSHDLRTPLAALQLRLDNAKNASPEEMREAVRTASLDCDRVQALAKGFMDLAKLEVTEDFENEPVMPEELIGQVVRGLAPIAEDANVRLRTRVTSQPTIWVDGHHTLRALENMVRNAIRHAEKQVVAGIERHGNKLHFYVLDDGEGFDGLEVGQRVDFKDWRGRRRLGGLGLRVAERVAHAHGGRLVISRRATCTLVVFVIDMDDNAQDDWASDGTETTTKDGDVQTH